MTEPQIGDMYYSMWRCRHIVVVEQHHIFKDSWKCFVLERNLIEMYSSSELNSYKKVV